jgi:hypothetical protein
VLVVAPLDDRERQARHGRVDPQDGHDGADVSTKFTRGIAELIGERTAATTL